MIGVVAFLLVLLTATSLRIRYRQFLRTQVAQQKLKAELPRLERDQDYVSSNQCRSCHPAQYHSWHQSFHRTMTQVASPESVIGRFDGSTLISKGHDYRVYREGDEFWAEMPNPDEMMFVVQAGKSVSEKSIKRGQYQVVMTTGSHHYQKYWVASPGFDRLIQTLPLVYLVEDERWIPRREAFMKAPNDRDRFVTQWNHHCIRCHSTGGTPGLDQKTGLLKTEVGELGIACESCHGPAENHVKHYQNPFNRYRTHISDDDSKVPKSDIVNPSKLDHRRSSQICGQCHGVFVIRDEFALQFYTEGFAYRPGDDIHQFRYFPQYPGPEASQKQKEDLKKNAAFYNERWWDDGTILAAGREYTAMMDSACYSKGEISCLSCHSMHRSDPVDQLKPEALSNHACTQCHQELQYTLELSRHTFHEEKSVGSECINCHMPHTSYALLSAIRSHQITSPNLESSVLKGVPNACNLCHLDKTLAWTQGQMAERYGAHKVRLSREQQSISAALLWLLKGHAAQRVITAWHFGWKPALEASGNQWQAPFLAQLLNDSYGVVRYMAWKSLKNNPGFSDFQYDFLDPSDKLKIKIELALKHWEKDQNISIHAGPEVLMDPDGTIMKQQMKHLLDTQDQRPVSITE